jgi:hypothetical protein
MKKIMAIESLNPAHGLLICEDTGVGPVKSKRIGKVIAEMEQYDDAELDARYIVEAVNLHAQLKPFLIFIQEVDAALKGFRSGYSAHSEFENIENAIKKARANIIKSAIKDSIGGKS